MGRIMGFIEAWNMLKDVWNLYRKYAVRKLSETELESLTYDMREIHKRYPYPFTKEIVLVVINELERSAKHFEE